MKIRLLIVALFLTATMTAQTSNHSMYFDGTDDEVQVADTSALVFTDNMTFEAWIKPLDIQGGGQRIIANKDGEYEFGVTPGGRFAYAIANTSPGWSWDATQANTPEDTWTHVAFTYNNGDIRIYENGVFVDSIVGSGSISNISMNSNDFFVGWRTANFDRHFKGYIDDVRLWNITRTDTEIAANWNTEISGIESGLVLYYKFDDMNSTCDVVDCSESKLHGTRNGMNGDNNLPQYSDTLTSITDVACGNPSCFPTSTTKANLMNIDAWFSNNQLYISNEKHQLLQVHFMNIQGQVVHITTSQNNNDVISFEHLSQGIYFVLLQNERGQQTHKVVKF